MKKNICSCNDFKESEFGYQIEKLEDIKNLCDLIIKQLRRKEQEQFSKDDIQNLVKEIEDEDEISFSIGDFDLILDVDDDLAKLLKKRFTNDEFKKLF